jgi:hypothetical protein
MNLRTATFATVLATLSGAAFATGIADGVVDNCSTLLGSLATELRVARALPGGERTSFNCPREREARAAVGASRERVLLSLVTPDRTGTDADGATTWSYAFASRFGRPALAGRGTPELSFHFDGEQRVRLLDCAYVP